jgi:hypothetical protein
LGKLELHIKYFSKRLISLNLPHEQQEFHTANLLGALTESLKANRPDATVDVEDLRVLFNEAEKDRVGNTIEAWNHPLSTAKQRAYARLNSVMTHATKGKKISCLSDSSDESPFHQNHQVTKNMSQRRNDFKLQKTLQRRG